MNNKEILQKIIDSNGSCNWIDAERCGADICTKCPMSKLVKRDDANYYSCVDALKVGNLLPEDQDKKYKETAERLLLDLSVEDMLQ